jgi:phosphatidylserine decarboxylase
MRLKSSLVIALIRLLPTRLVSRFTGLLARIPLPPFLLNPLIQWYVKRFGIDMNQFQVPVDGFRSFDAFFTREFRSDMRPVADPDVFVASPVDGRVAALGQIDDDRILQAKGIDYGLHDLVPSEYAEAFREGSFITLYLSPADYHRIHSPVPGTLAGYLAIPGRLLTVQEFMVGGYPGLFTKNERLIACIDSGRGRVACCMIGATNVGRISLSRTPLETNRTFGKREEMWFTDEERLPLEAGQEIGIFHLGSTVILLFEKEKVNLDMVSIGSAVRMGQALGRYL